jgi:hypothetical protein
MISINFNYSNERTMIKFVLIIVFLTYVSAQNCTNELCGHGKCVENECVCDKGWLTFNNSLDCEYEQKKQTIAFIKEFFLGIFGEGYDYLGYTSAGEWQRRMTLINFWCWLVGDAYKIQFLSIFSIVLFSIFLGSWVTFLTKIGTNEVTDSLGMPLLRW